VGQGRPGLAGRVELFPPPSPATTYHLSRLKRRRQHTAGQRNRLAHARSVGQSSWPQWHDPYKARPKDLDGSSVLSIYPATHLLRVDGLHLLPP
jgi:hypothetical protein